MELPQITGETVGEVRPVAGMHQRKAEMARQADAFIALPGTLLYYLIFILGSPLLHIFSHFFNTYLAILSVI